MSILVLHQYFGWEWILQASIFDPYKQTVSPMSDSHPIGTYMHCGHWNKKLQTRGYFHYTKLEYKIPNIFEIALKYVQGSKL